MSRLPSRLLNRYDRKADKQRKPIITVDIETRAIGQGNADVTDFILGAWSREHEDEVHYFHTPQAWLEAIFDSANRGYIWYAHNGGEFDYKFLVPALEEWRDTTEGAKLDIITQGRSGRVIGFVMRHNKRRFELRDSYALVSTSLKKFSQQFSPDLVKLDFDWEQTEFDPHNADHIAYLDADVLSLKKALLAFFEIIDQHFEVDVAWTIAATAMRAWRHTLPRGWGFWRQRREVEDFCRKAYYGGLVFLTGLQTRSDAAAVDVNSMYPYVMRQAGVPTGTAVYVTQRDRQYPGYYRVIAHCPINQPFTCIPYRDETDMLMWPTGDFETYLNSVDMDMGERLGYIFEVIEGYEFECVENLFGPFVNKCEKLRIEMKGTAVEAAVKILQNGLYGKFGTNPNSVSYMMSNELLDDASPVLDERTGTIVPGLYVKEEELQASYIMPHWASWITASARSHLVGICESIGFEHVYYGDTDSVTADRTALEAAGLSYGVQYGQVKLEHEYQRFVARGPKNYMGIEKDGSIAVKSKGIPKRVAVPAEMQRVFDGEDIVFSFPSVNATLQIIKNKAPHWTNRTRHVSQIENSRAWRVVDTVGNVRPPHLLWPDLSFEVS